MRGKAKRAFIFRFGLDDIRKAEAAGERRGRIAALQEFLKELEESGDVSCATIKRALKHDVAELEGEVGK